MDTQKTKICCLNLDENIIDFLSKDFDIYNGSLGKMVDVTEEHKNFISTNLLLNYDIPNNVHEYQVFIIDLGNKKTIKYNSKEHTRERIMGECAYYFVSKKPETIFNPIPYGCEVLRNYLQKGFRPILNIIFQDVKQIVSYTIKEITYCNEKKIEKTNYSLTADFTDQPLFGKEIKICDNNVAKLLFPKFKNEIEYYQTYIQQTVRNKNTGEVIPDNEHFIPLLTNIHGDIVSYIWQSKDEITFMLPQLKSKEQLLDILFKEILYCYFSEYFPSVAANSWKKRCHYYLPGQQSLQEEKERIKRKYEIDIKDINLKIEKNDKEYKFLHDILSESGSALVSAIIIYLKWLGFENVLYKDETVKNDFFEEDIQVDLGEKGLLIIEVKGLHGTSKDSECSQISKIRYRRCEERGKFDVYGLYIVNNERSIEPLKRTIPPFNDTQIKDAKNDKRGLVYTWQLFNLFFNIENGLLTKEEARGRFLMTGLVDFTPQFVKLGKPYAFYQNRTVVCVELFNVQLSNKDVLAYEYNGQYKLLQIEEIQQDKSVIYQVSNGKVGIKVNKSVPKISMLYLVNGK